MRKERLSSVVAVLESGSRPKGGVQEGTEGVLSLGAEHLDGKGGFDFSKVKRIPREYFGQMKKGRVARGDILVVKDGATTGKTSFVGAAFPDEPTAVNEHVFIVRVDSSRAFPAYVFRFLRSPRGQLQVLSDFRGATVGGVSRGFVDRVKIPLPPLPEQRRIAAILDKADAVRRKRQQTLDLADQFLRSAFLDMFGDPVTNPKGWPVKKLGELLVFLTSGSRGWARYYSEEGAAFLRIQNVGRNRLLLDDLAHVIPPDTKEAERTRLQTGDVVLSITADLGRAAVIPDSLGPAHVNQHLGLLRVEDIEPLFLAEFLITDAAQLQFRALDTGQTRSGLNFNDLKRLKIPLPPMELQKGFASMHSRGEESRIRYQKLLSETGELSSTLVQRAFLGEL
jgi:type I restriction enzyme S subunit